MALAASHEVDVEGGVVARRRSSFTTACSALERRIRVIRGEVARLVLRVSGISFRYASMIAGWI